MKPYRLLVHWQDGRVETVAVADDPTRLAGAPMVSRNRRAIKRIELHDLTGCLETIWDADWPKTRGTNNPKEPTND